MADRVTKLHLYMGDGKGKTTAAMGLALRALGSGMTVYIAQFLKTGFSSELMALREMKNVTVESVESIGKFTFKMNDAEKAEAKTRQTGALIRIQETIAALRPELMVFDELALAMHLGMTDAGAAMALIEQGLTLGEVVLTGRYAPESLVKRADYVSEIHKIAHPYGVGLRARKGIEF